MLRQRRGRIADLLQYAIALFLLAIGIGVVAVGPTGAYHPIGPGNQRSDTEQSELLREGTCAVRPDGTIVGKVIGHLGATRGLPRRRLQLAEIARHRTIMADARDVTLVPCRELLLEAALPEGEITDW